MPNVVFDDLEDGLSSTLGDELNARLGALKTALNGLDDSTLTTQDPVNGGAASTLRAVLSVLHAAIDAIDPTAHEPVDLSGAGAVLVLTDSQCRKVSLIFEGTLTQNTTVEFPARASTWRLRDATSRAGFTLDVRKTGGESTALNEGETAYFESSP